MHICNGEGLREKAPSIDMTTASSARTSKALRLPLQPKNRRSEMDLHHLHASPGPSPNGARAYQHPLSTTESRHD